MKIAPLYHALKKTDWAGPVIVHTGQNYDLNTSEAFFKDLLLPASQHPLEAGLRSFDRSMPVEINRVVTDAIADILWTPSPDGDENLLREGIAPGEDRAGRQHLLENQFNQQNQ
jgi:UDP-N-acetylglucosamine 2-epimerase